MEDLKLQNKFYGFCGTLIFAVVFTAILSVHLIGQINDSSKEVSHNWLPSVIVAEELNTMTSDFRIAEISHVVSQDTEKMERYEAKLIEVEQGIDELFDMYINELITNDIDSKLILDAYEMWNEYLDIHHEMIEYSYENITWVVIIIIIMSIVVFINFRKLMQEIRATQKELGNAREEALGASKAKSNFLANMSHEIRTPMNAISGMVDIILRDSKEQDTKESAHNIKRASESLISIINDVLDISKIESGKLEIITTEYNLSALLNDVITIVNNRLESKNLMFITNFSHDMPEKIIGDEIRVKQILVNILNNAVKFTHEGHIMFNVYSEMRDEKLQMKFEIIDTGMGIDKEDLEKLFIEFERVNTTKNRSIEGTGLGLAITKRLCEMMEGDIQIESEINKGSKFTVTLTQECKEYIPYASIDADKSVLIVESRELHLESIKNACHDLNISVVDTCKLQSDLNNALSERSYDYIFVASIYHLKAEELIKTYKLDTKLVLLADNFDMKVKNENLTMLLPANALAIANIINGKQTNIHSEMGQNRFSAPDCRVLIVDDNIVNLKVAQGLMKPYGFQMDTAENGKQAVDKIKEHRYDLVFMDHMMPIMDGIDATVMIRSFEEEYFKNVPIIALTANAVTGTREMFIENGMNDFLSKPININLLNEILVKWVPTKMQISEEVQVTPEVLEEEILTINNVDVELGLSRVGGDLSTYITILDMYYKDGIKRVCDLQNFLDSNQISEYKICIHALKSASGAIGASSVSEKARLLEEACTKNNLLYINQNNDNFINEFNQLQEDIRTAINGQIHEENEDKEDGNDDLLKTYLEQLKEALDNFDISACEDVLSELSKFEWEDDKGEDIATIKDMIAMYEYDEAIAVIDKIMKYSSALVF